ncbi:MAG: ribosomal protein S18-alanine N-acetyltransferase [Lachnospiraceae bacterium]|nr:ribosomal protein S18-alanine N-acetyltransferase [Lachnospiraceae bacterium]MDY6222441.1 ribosomal protein S18-alanine N-acetyltransferase [Candidatus Alectryocaccobium sp.]
MTEIRSMGFEDIEAVVKIEKENFSVPWDENGFLSFMLREGTMFLTALNDNEVVGYCGLISAADEADITNVSVSQSMRKKGIGGMLLSELIKEAGESGIKKIFLEVRESNIPAISLYNGFGFKQVGMRKDYYEKPVENALLMLKEL